MTSSTERKWGVILQYMQMGLNIAVSLIYTPLMLRILGQAEYGIYNLANSIISYLSLLSLGFGASYMRFYSRYRAVGNERGVKRLNGLYMLVFMTMGTLALICGLIFSFHVSMFFNASYSAKDLSIARVLMVFMSVNLALSFPDSVFSAYVTSQERFVFQKLLNMIKTVVSPLLTLPLLLLGYGSIGMVAVSTVITVGVNVINLAFCIKRLKMPFEFKNPDFKLLKEIAVFSSFIALNQIVDQINWATDKLVLGKICTGSAVAVYALGSQFNNYYLSFSTAISNVFVPQVNMIVASEDSENTKNKRLTELFTKVGRIQFMVLMLILLGFIFFGKFFILKWAGVEYESSYYVALLLIVPVTIPLIQNLGIEIQRAKNLHQFRSFIYLGMAILNVIISIFLAKKWSEIGAAAGTAISLILANGIIMNIFYEKKIGIDVIYFWKEILKFGPSLTLPVAVGLIMNRITYINIVDFILRIALFSMIYAISVYLLGMNSFEKEQIKGILQKCIGHKK